MPIYGNRSLVCLPYEVVRIAIEREDSIVKYTDNVSMLENKINESKRIYRDNHNAATYCFVQYIPQAIGIVIGRCITKVPVLMAHFGRLSNMIICITLMYFTIKNIPFGKNILLVLSIIPITIEGFATLSADGITFAMACFYIAYTLKIVFDENQRCGTKQVITLAIAGGILALCKFVYLPIVFLALLIPKEKFQSKKEKVIAMTLILLVAIVLNLIWLCYGSIALAKTDNTGLMPKIMQIIKNPIEYIEKIIYTISQNFNDYIWSALGGQLEWLEQVKLNVIPYILLGLIGIVTVGDKKLKNRFTTSQKILICLIILAITGLIFTSIFLQWTTNKTQINGVQGRYFLPIFPLILFLVGNIKLQTSYDDEKITKVITITGYIIAICVAISIMANHI